MDKKHYILTSLTLGLIGAASALLVGGANLLTSERIKENEVKKINDGIATIFGKESKVEKSESKEDAKLSKEYKYTNTIYTVIKNGDDSYSGYAIRTLGSNMYGKISLIIGYEESSKAFLGLTIVTNEQTYASTLVENYINPLNNDDIDVEDVKCGATYGAKLVRDMVLEAKEVALELWGK